MTILREMKQDRIALDRSALSARTLDEHSGHLHVAQTNISKATVNPYRGDEIPYADELGLEPDKIYQLLRHPDELAKGAASFNGKPIVLLHRLQKTTDQDHDNRVGSVSNVRFEAPFLKADLAVWTKEAIDAIEDETQRELSCGYAYKPVMTPGTFEGQRYDGIMTAIGGNHVALVKEGRAGADCHVFDSLERLQMTSTKLSPKGAVAQGALIAYLRPKLAQDKKIDLRPTLKGVTITSFKADKPRIAADIKRQVTGKLAKDANVDDVMELLDALEEVIPEMEVEKIESVENASDPVDGASDADDTALRDFLRSLGLSDEDIDTACAKASAPAATDSGAADPDGPDDPGLVSATSGGAAVVSAPGGSTGPGNDPVAGRDKKFGKDKDMVSKTAMDAAIAASATVIRASERSIRLAMDAVRPHVGSLSIDADSETDVYKAALECKGIAFDGVPPAAYKALFDNVMASRVKPTVSAEKIAQDAAATKSFGERFGTGRIHHAA